MGIGFDNNTKNSGIQREAIALLIKWLNFDSPLEETRVFVEKYRDNLIPIFKIGDIVTVAPFKDGDVPTLSYNSSMNGYIGEPCVIEELHSRIERFGQPVFKVKKQGSSQANYWWPQDKITMLRNQEFELEKSDSPSW